MSDIKEQLIKLGAQCPSLRNDIKPVLDHVTARQRKASETREEALLRFWDNEHPRYTFDASHLVRGGGMPDIRKLDELGKITDDFRARPDIAVYEDGQRVYVVKMVDSVPMAAEVSRPLMHWGRGYRPASLSKPTKETLMSNLKEQLIKLGAAHKELQPHIRPVLDVITKTAARGIFMEAKVKPEQGPLSNTQAKELEKAMERRGEKVSIEAGFDGLYIEWIADRPQVPAERLTEERSKGALASALQMAAEDALGTSSRHVFVFEKNIEVRDFQIRE